MSSFLQLCLAVISGFIGGWLGPRLLALFAGTSINQPADAIAVANTYIVFTTFIFAAFSAVIAVIGYWFAQQFATGKEERHKEVVAELKDRLRQNEELAIDMLTHILKQDVVVEHLDEALREKIQEKLTEGMNQSNASLSTLQSLNEGIKQQGGSDAKRK